MISAEQDRPTAGLLLGITTMLVGGLLAAEVTDGIVGCGSVDPTAPANHSSIRIANTTSLPVIIDDRRGAYCQLTQPKVLQPGQQFSDYAACGATGSEMTSWRVTSANRQLHGYTAARSPKSRNDLLDRVSHASAERFTATPEG